MTQGYLPVANVNYTVRSIVLWTRIVVQRTLCYLHGVFWNHKTREP